jgi:hypothetical protein
MYVQPWHLDSIARFADHHGHGERNDDDLQGRGEPMGSLGSCHHRRCRYRRKFDGAFDQTR